MADDVTKSVGIVFSSQGAERTEKAIKNIQDEIDRLAKSKKLDEDATKRLSQVTNRAEQAWDKYANEANQAAQATQRNSTAANTAAGANANLNKSVQSMAGNLPRLRYALYDVSSTLSFAGVAMAGLATATAATAISMDRQFADVVRTTGAYTDSTGQAVAGLRDEFNGLLSTLPASWSDLTDIGTLAGQLGIASENVSEFTSLVAKFSSVTDVSVEASATAFGRLSELLNVSASEYENLGSSIAAVGVASVATESEIIAISSQIASMGAFVGLSADEVIGLSSALASLGTQPELSRGVVTRLFTNITKSISEGGDQLEAFGRLAGTTGQEFATAWGDDAASALIDLLQGLERVDASGGDAVQTLNQLGITSVRDVPTILKLAQNYELVADQLGIASQGYAEGTALQEQYGVIAETVASKLEVLKNNIQLLVGTVGESAGVFAGLIDILTNVVKVMTAIAENPVGQALSGLVIGLTAVGGVLALVAGAAARGAAGLLAMQTAAVDLSASGVTGSLSMRGLQASLEGVGAAGRAASLSITGIKYALVSTGIGAAIAILGTAVAALWQSLASGNSVTRDLEQSLSGFGDAVKADTKAYNEASGAAKEAFTTYTSASQEVKTATDNSSEAAQLWVGLQSDVADAATTASEAIDQQTIAFGENATAAIQNALSQNEAIQKIAQDSSATAILNEVGFSWSDAIEAGLRDGSEGILAYTDEITARLGESVTSAEFGQVREVFADVYAALDAVGAQVDTQRALADALEFVGGTAGQAGLDVDDYADSASTAAEETINLGNAAFDSINGLVNMNQAVYDLGNSLYENGGTFDAYSQAGRENLAALESAFSAASDAAGGDAALYTEYVNQILAAMVGTGQVSVETLAALSNQGVDLGNSFVDVGNKVNQVLASIQRGITSATNAANAAIAAGSDNVAARNLATVGRLQAQQSYFEGETIDYIKRQATEINKTNPLLDQMGRGWQAAGDKAAASGKKQSKAAKDAQEEVRTLSDYVSDLSSVFSDAFEFRFGFDQATDDVNNSRRALKDYFSDLRDDVESAKQSIRDYRTELKSIRADIAGLGADRDKLNYFLSIAVEYGDTLRATQIQAELAKNAADTEEKQNELKDTQADLNDATKDLNKAQEDLIPNLDGTTAASREQREMVLSLITNYQGLIEQYANTGATQQEVARYTEQLRGKFETQLRQLGYNEAAIDDYSAAFKDFKTIVDSVPRNLTVKVNSNTSPAEKALREFTAKQRSTTVDAKVSTPSSGSLKSQGNAIRSGLQSGLGGSPLKAPDAVIQTKIKSPTVAQWIKLRDEIRKRTGDSSFRFAYEGQIGSGTTFATGGYTGRGGKYEPAGTVHRGEYVVPKEQVNQSTGLPYADAFARLSRGVPSPGYANGGYVRPTSSMPSTVNLSPMSIQQIARAVQPYLVMDNKVVGQAAGKNFQNNTRTGAY